MRAIGYDTNFVYNWDGKLRHAEAASTTIDLKYDPMGNRVQKASSTQGTRKYVVDIAGDLPTILLEINSASGSIMKSYVYANGEILAQHDGDVNAARYFYLHDRLGSVRELIGTDGLVKNYYTYEPFGQLAGGGETIENPFKFTGQYFDSETGQYYLRSRMYDPILGRFTSRDPIVGKFEESLTLHKYLYCINDPMNYTDPSGQYSVTDVAVTSLAYATFGALSSGGYAFVDELFKACNTGKQIDWGRVYNAAKLGAEIGAVTGGLGAAGAWIGSEVGATYTIGLFSRPTLSQFLWRCGISFAGGAITAELTSNAAANGQMLHSTTYIGLRNEEMQVGIMMLAETYGD